MTRRIIFMFATLLAVGGGLGYYLWAGRSAAVGPPPPLAPAELTDPPARKVVEGMRQPALAALRGGTAWGELAMAFDAHDTSAEAVACYRRAMDLDPKDARWPFLLAGQLNRSGAGADKEEAVRLYRRAGCLQSPRPPPPPPPLPSLAPAAAAIRPPAPYDPP